MEKLVEILRKKVNGPMEAVSRIRDVLASDVCHIPEGPTKEPMSRMPLSSSSSSEDEDENDNDDDDYDVHDGKSDASKSDRDSSIASDSKTPLVIDSNVNLSGPVTDL
ncbi:unnamed protein product [Lasius platythorax]|uniref:Uncharacterized protein n=3 Tax=Lasius TaxID=488720 RepID=A0A0J7L1S8_LASNI|nr:hypothetical protein RF55_3079 [Lasius niger]